MIRAYLTEIRLNPAFHLQALMELARVAKTPVRIFLLLQHTGHENPQLLDRLPGQLCKKGVDSEVRQVDDEFQRGGYQMLVCTKPRRR